MRDRPFSWNVQLPVLGLPTRFEADDPKLLELVYQAYGYGTAPAPVSPANAALTAAHIRLRLARAGASDEPLRIVTERDRLQLCASGARGEADALTRSAWATIPQPLLADGARLTEEVLDTLTLFLLTRAGRIPLHAAGIVMGETAVALAGPSGTGKSTLALAAARAGHAVLSDDALYVQVEPTIRLWALPRPIHVAAPAVADLQLQGKAGPARLRRGRWKHPVQPGPSPSQVPQRAALVLLRRGDAVAIRRVPPALAARELTRTLEPGFDVFRDAVPAVVRGLSAGGAWLLTLSRDPAAAVAALGEAMGERLTLGEQPVRVASRDEGVRGQQAEGGAAS